MVRKKTTLKKVDDSIIEIKESKKTTWFFYRCFLTGLDKPMNEAGIERLAKEVVEWARSNPDALKISQFYLDFGIPRSLWNDWCQKWPLLRQANDFAKEVIGNRRENGALNNKLNPSMVSFTMPIYDEDWKEESVRRASLKDGSSEAKTTVHVTMSPIPNSSLVPERKSDE